MRQSCVVEGKNRVRVYHPPINRSQQADFHGNLLRRDSCFRAPRGYHPAGNREEIASLDIL